MAKTQYGKPGQDSSRLPHRLDAFRRAYSGGSDSVRDDWDTWSGQSDREYLNERPNLVYEHLPFKELPLEKPPSIHRELMRHGRFV